MQINFFNIRKPRLFDDNKRPYIPIQPEPRAPAITEITASIPAGTMGKFNRHKPDKDDDDPAHRKAKKTHTKK